MKNLTLYGHSLHWLAENGTVPVGVSGYIENSGGRFITPYREPLPFREALPEAVYAMLSGRYIRVRVEVAEKAELFEGSIAVLDEGTLPLEFVKPLATDDAYHSPTLEQALRALPDSELARLGQEYRPGTCRVLDVEVWHRWPHLRRIYDHAMATAGTVELDEEASEIYESRLQSIVSGPRATRAARP